MNGCLVRVSVRNQDGGSTMCAPPPDITALLHEFIITQLGRVYVDPNSNNPSNFSLALQLNVNCLQVVKDIATKLLLSCQERSVLDRISIKCVKHQFVALECPAAPEKDAASFTFKQYGEIVGYTKDNKGGSRFLLARKNLKLMSEVPQSYRMRLVDRVHELARLTAQELDLFSQAPKISLKRPALNSGALQGMGFGEMYYGGQWPPSRPRTMDEEQYHQPPPQVNEAEQQGFGDFHEALLQKSQVETDCQQPGPSSGGQAQQTLPVRSVVAPAAIPPRQESTNRQAGVAAGASGGGGGQKIKHLMKFRVTKATSDPCADYEDDFKKWLENTDHQRQYEVKWPKKIGPGPSGRIEIEINFEFQSCQHMIKTTQELAMASYFVDTFKVSFLFRAFKISLTDMFEEVELEDRFIVVQDDEGQVSSDEDGYHLVILRGNSFPKTVKIIEEMYLDPTTSRLLLQREMKRIKDHQDSSVYEVDDD